MNRPIPNELTPEQKVEIRSLLEAKAQDLIVSIARYDEQIAPIAPDASLGRLTRLDAMQQQEMAKAQRANAKTQLTKVKRLLEDWDDNEAGMCRSCEDPIGYGRLKRVPDSLVCITCLEDAV